MPAAPDNLAHFAPNVFRALVLHYSWLTPLLFFFCAFVLMLIIGSPMIEWLRCKRWKKNAAIDETWTVREDTPDSHQAKQGTPSMGGIGIAVSALLSYTAVCLILFFLAALTLRPPTTFSYDAVAFVALLAMPITFAVHTALGFADDWSKASGRGGLRARSKLFFQAAFAFCFVGTLWFGASFSDWGNSPTPNFLALGYHGVALPSHFELWLWDFSSVFVLSCIVIIMATSNAVNLTDGIDGLAAGLAVQAGIAFCLCGRFFQSNFNSYGADVGGFNILFWAALAGACLGFLNFNKHKARVFMGDTGSLAIGAALGAGAILQHAVFLLPFIGFIYFVEAASVTLQVLWFKWTKRTRGEGQRIFRRAPLHHHFELGGWSEWRVVLTFWLVNLCTTAIGLWLWHTGVLPRWP